MYVSACRRRQWRVSARSDENAAPSHAACAQTNSAGTEPCTVRSCSCRARRREARATVSSRSTGVVRRGETHDEARRAREEVAALLALVLVSLRRRQDAGLARRPLAFGELRRAGLALARACATGAGRDGRRVRSRADVRLPEGGEGGVSGERHGQSRARAARERAGCCTHSLTKPPPANWCSHSGRIDQSEPLRALLLSALVKLL